MIKNKDFTGSVDSNSFYFNYFNLNHLTLYFNGRPIERGAASNTPHVQSVVFHAAFCPYADRAASEGHVSLPDQGNIRLELRFYRPIPEAVTCLLYLEYDNCVRIDELCTVSIEF
jgi:hypothetical protein